MHLHSRNINAFGPFSSYAALPSRLFATKEHRTWGRLDDIPQQMGQRWQRLAHLLQRKDKARKRACRRVFSTATAYKTLHVYCNAKRGEKVVRPVQKEER